MSKSIYIIAACSLVSTLSWAENAINLEANTSYAKEGSAHKAATQTTVQSQTVSGAGAVSGSMSGTHKTNSNLVLGKPETSPAKVDSNANSTAEPASTSAVMPTTTATSATNIGASTNTGNVKPASAIKTSQAITGSQTITAGQEQSHNLATKTQTALDSGLDITHNADATQAAVSENIANSVNNNVSQAVNAATATAINQTISNQVNSTINQEIGDAVKASINNSVNNTITQNIGL